MKLLEVYEDLFQYMCCLNRTAKTQAHPEFRSRPTRPHPLFTGLIRAALARTDTP